MDSAAVWIALGGVIASVITAIGGMFAGMAKARHEAEEGRRKAAREAKRDALAQSNEFNSRLLVYQEHLRAELGNVYEQLNICQEDRAWAEGQIEFLRDRLGLPHEPRKRRDPIKPITPVSGIPRVKPASEDDPGFLARTNEQDLKLLKEESERLAKGAKDAEDTPPPSR